MHKKLSADLISLAHSILQMKDKEDVKSLKLKAHQVYEKLSILEYVDEYINTTPQAEETKEELIEKIETAENTIVLEVENKVETDAEVENEVEVENNTEVEDDIIGELEDEEIQMTDAADDFADAVIEQIESEPEEEYIEQPFEELEELLGVNDLKNDAADIGDLKTPTLEEELQDTVSVDTVLDLFESAPSQPTLNEQLQTTIQIDLNDRIAFVKNLFDGSQGDFNRVVSQLNTFKTYKEAKKFVNKMVKPDYDWTDKEEFENRFFEVIERKFK